MLAAFELGGMGAAFAISAVAEGEDVMPALVFDDDEGETSMERFALEDPAEAVDFGEGKLASNEMNANDAALIYDAQIQFEDEQQPQDVIIIQLRTFASPDSEAVVALPYTPKDTGKFQLHTPQVLAWENCDDFDLDEAFQSFFGGLSSQEQGWAIWNESFDNGE